MRWFPLLALVAGCDTVYLAPGADPDPGADRDVSPDFGALWDGAGTTFRVWAPNATAVSVVGDFDGWVDDADPMASEGNGVWKVRLDGAVPGDAYQFVLHNGTQVARKADPRARQMTNSVGNSVIVDPNAFRWRTTGYATPPWNETVIYELHVGTFNDQPGGNPGTFLSAIERLDDLQDLGVNAIELMPSYEFPGDGSWGYNPAWPYAPESTYGDPDDLKLLIDEAHARGIAVLLDVVHNHWGPDDLGMWCFDLECYGKGGVYFYTDWRSESGWGPRPDFGRPEIHDYIRDNTMMWLNEYRADGLRWDSTVNIRKANGSDLADGKRLLQESNDDVDATQPWKLMIAEDLQDDPLLTAGAGSGGAGFDTQWDGRFFHPIDAAITTAWDSDRHMWDVANAIRASYNGVASQRVIYTESHDEVANGKSRIPQMIDPANPGSWYARKRSTLGAALVMTSPGIPMLFQGQEVLEDGWFTDTDPVDWSKETTWAGIRAMYRDLVHLRRNFDDHTAGLRGNNVNVFHVNDSAKVVAFHRWDQGGAGDDVVVVVNFANTAYASYDIGMPRGGTWKVRFNSDWNGYSADFANTSSNDTTAYSGGKDGLGYHASIGLGPYTVVILSQ